MTEDEQSPACADTTNREDARIGYQMAIALWTYQGEQFWARFNTMLVVHSAIIGASTWALSNLSSPSAQTFILPLAGVFLCAIWQCVSQREATYADYYVLMARELENKYMSNSVHTVAGGRELAEGRPVTVDIVGDSVRNQMGWWARRFPAKSASTIVIAVLGLIYIGLLLLAASGQVPSLLCPKVVI